MKLNKAKIIKTYKNFKDINHKKAIICKLNEDSI